MFKFYRVVVPNQYLDKLLYKGEIVVFCTFFINKYHKKIFNYYFRRYNGCFDDVFFNFSTIMKIEHSTRPLCETSSLLIGRLSEDTELFFLEKKHAKKIKRKIKELRNI